MIVRNMNPYIRMLKMLLWRKSSLLFIFYLTYHDNKGIHWVTANPSKTFLQRRMSGCVGGEQGGQEGGKTKQAGKNLINKRKSSQVEKNLSANKPLCLNVSTHIDTQ